MHIFFNLRHKKKQLHEQKVFGNHFYILCANFEKIIPEIKKKLFFI